MAFILGEFHYLLLVYKNFAGEPEASVELVRHVVIRVLHQLDASYLDGLVHRQVEVLLFKLESDRYSHVLACCVSFTLIREVLAIDERGELPVAGVLHELNHARVGFKARDSAENALVHLNVLVDQLLGIVVDVFGDFDDFRRISEHLFADVAFVMGL